MGIYTDDDKTEKVQQQLTTAQIIIKSIFCHFHAIYSQNFDNVRSIHVFIQNLSTF